MADDKGKSAAAEKSRWPLWANLALFFILSGLVLNGQIFSGRILLPEDSAYQRLMVARNLISHFAWGINPGEFISAFGTLLWPVLLAPGYLISGAGTLWPLILNAVLSIVWIVLAYRIICRWIESPLPQCFFLALWVVALPLAPLSASGMETVLFLLLLLVFLELWARRMESAPGAGILPLAGAATLLAATRYEGMVLVALAALFLLLRRDIVAGMIVPVAAAIPLAVFGIFSWRAGWLPVPASVYLRRAELIPSGLPQLPSIIFRSLDTLDVRSDLRAVILVITLIPAALGMTKRLESMRERAFFAPALAALAILAHLTLVGGREIRYDAWLVGIGGWALLPALGKILPTDSRALWKNPAALFAGGALAVLLGLPFMARGVQGALSFEDSIPQAKLLVRAAEGVAQCTSGPVATDAPGMVAFVTGRQVIDLSGFASLSAFRQRRGGSIGGDWLREEVGRSSASVAIVFQPDLQAQAGSIWTTIGIWRPEGCEQCGTVGIYAITMDPQVSACLSAILKARPADEIVPGTDGGSG